MKTKLFRRILVPHDFSVQARAALRVAFDLAAAHGGAVTVLHVLSPPTSMVELAWNDPAALRSVLREQLEEEVESAKRASRCKVRCIVKVGDPVSAILAAARAADSIVMATLGQTGVARWLVGSVAERIVRLSPIPVLTLRVKDKRGTRRRAKKTR